MVRKEGDWCCTITNTSMSESWLGVTVSKIWDLSTSPLMSPCTQGFTKFLSAKSAGKMTQFGRCARILCSAATNPPTSVFKGYTQFIELVHCVMNWARTLALEYDMLILPDGMFDLARYMHLCWLIPDASLSACF